MANEIRGVDVLLKKNGVAIAGQKDCTLSIKSDKIDTSTKTNEGWKTALAGLSEYSISMDCVNYVGAAAAGQRAVRRAAIDKTTLEVVYAVGLEEVYMGEVVVVGLDLTGPMSDVSMSSFSLEGASALTCEFAPEFSSLAVSGTNKVATITLSEDVVTNVADAAALKAAVTFAANGTTFSALASADTVAITSGKLVVTFDTAFTGSTNKITIAAQALKTTNGAIHSEAIVTSAFAAA